MIIVLGFLILFLIYYEIFILKRFDFKRMDIEDLLSRFDERIDNLISEVVKDINFTNIHSEEDLYCYLIEETLEELEVLLIREGLTEKEYELLHDQEKVKDYISSRLSDIDVSVIWQKRMYQYTSKQKEENTEFATEQVSNDTKSDDSTVNILNEINSIFFE